LFRGKKQLIPATSLLLGGESPPQTLTAMQHAFLAALITWARRQSHGAVVLPVGRADPSELRAVVVAFLCAKAEGARR
jgi:hypothetical protein